MGSLLDFRMDRSARAWCRIAPEHARPEPDRLAKSTGPGRFDEMMRIKKKRRVAMTRPSRTR